MRFKRLTITVIRDSWVRVPAILALTLLSPELRSQDRPFAEFDVASVKPSDKDSPYGQSLKSAPGTLVLRNMEPTTMIANAYGLSTSSISGAPTWADREVFDVTAKADGDGEINYGDARKRNMLRLQSLLERRFQFKFHWETRSRPGYVLGIARGGAKMAVSTSGVERPRSHMGASSLGCKGCEISGLAQLLSALLERPVVNGTELGGRFDFELHFARESSVVSDIPAGPSIFTAVTEQLGLKLVARAVPVKTLVVEHLERPSAN